MYHLSKFQVNNSFMLGETVFQKCNIGKKMRNEKNAFKV